MVVLCFLLDLCSLSPPLLRDLKQCLLQLANLYAISSHSLAQRRSDPLRDRIGLCYVFRNRISSSHELNIAYSPRGNFRLRDFHHAVNNLPADAFSPEIDDSGALGSSDVKLQSVLSDQVLYSWGDKDFMRKVVVFSSCIPEKIDSDLKSTLTDAADKCVSVEFVLFEQSTSYLSNMQDSITYFARSFSDLDNCSFQTYLPDSRVFHSLVKRWLQDLKDDMEEPLQARFIFKYNLVGSSNQITCSLSVSCSQIVDGFDACQTCRCHGILLDDAVKDKVGKPCCSVTGHDLGTAEVIDNSVKVGDKTILFMPSFQGTMTLRQLSSPIEFHVIERTSLSSLSEGVVFGTSHYVAPSACNEIFSSSVGMFEPEMNFQLFQGICSALYSMDQGLVCSSYFNVETMRETAFLCYYILQPSENGPMLLRRLAGLEEVFPTPDINPLTDSPVSNEIQNAIYESVLKIELRDYNPVLHERGLHQKLNLLVKESLQFGSIPLKQNDATSELNLKQPDSSELIVKSNCTTDTIVIEDEPSVPNLTLKEDKITSIAEEWEQLVVTEVPRIYSPTSISKPKIDILVLSSPDSNKQLDVKTSRILERLEVPRQLKTKTPSPILIGTGPSETCLPSKKPLIPFQPAQATELSWTSNQLMKPNFQRAKKKHK